VPTPVAAASERKPRERLDLRLIRSDPRASTFVMLAISGGLLAAVAVIGQAVLLSRLLAVRAMPPCSG
jgi:hypothetical protein